MSPAAESRSLKGVPQEIQATEQKIERLHNQREQRLAKARQEAGRRAGKRLIAGEYIGRIFLDGEQVKIVWKV